MNWSFDYNPIYWDIIHFLGNFFLVAIFNQIFILPDALRITIWSGHMWEVKDAYYEDGYSVRDIVSDVSGAMLYYILHKKKEKYAFR